MLSKESLAEIYISLFAAALLWRGESFSLLETWIIIKL